MDIQNNVKCYGRYSGTDKGWMMFEDDNGNIWEERANEWEEVLDLIRGFSVFRNKNSGLIVNSK